MISFRLLFVCGLWWSRATAQDAECISSLSFIQNAEALVTDASVQRTYVLCRNTTFFLTRSEARTEPTLVSQLFLYRPNVAIQCQETTSSESEEEGKCILDGRAIESLQEDGDGGAADRVEDLTEAQIVIGFPSQLKIESNVARDVFLDNIVLTGLTFTGFSNGTTTATTGNEKEGSKSNVAILSPANVQLNNCTFQDNDIGAVILVSSDTVDLSPTVSPTMAPTTATDLPTAAPAVNALPTIAPVATAPPTTAPVLTASPTTAPVLTAPPTTAPVLTAPPTTAPVLTASPTTALVLTALPTTAPVLTASPTTAPALTASPTTAPVGVTASPSTSVPSAATNAPTKAPANMVEDSAVPSEQPVSTAFPTVVTTSPVRPSIDTPSFSPLRNPTITQSPETQAPEPAQTAKPTSNPTTSAMPSVINATELPVPSLPPTVAPFEEPISTAYPTVFQTTVDPTPSPTEHPSPHPTDAPVPQPVASPLPTSTSYPTEAPVSTAYPTVIDGFNQIAYDNMVREERRKRGSPLERVGEVPSPATPEEKRFIHSSHRQTTRRKRRRRPLQFLDWMQSLLDKDFSRGGENNGSDKQQSEKKQEHQDEGTLSGDTIEKGEFWQRELQVGAPTPVPLTNFPTANTASPTVPPTFAPTLPPTTTDTDTTATPTQVSISPSLLVGLSFLQSLPDRNDDPTLSPTTAAPVPLIVIPPLVTPVPTAASGGGVAAPTAAPVFVIPPLVTPVPTEGVVVPPTAEPPTAAPVFVIPPLVTLPPTPSVSVPPTAAPAVATAETSSPTMVPTTSSRPSVTREIFLTIHSCVFVDNTAVASPFPTSELIDTLGTPDIPISLVVENSIFANNGVEGGPGDSQNVFTTLMTIQFGDVTLNNNCFTNNVADASLVAINRGEVSMDVGARNFASDNEGRCQGILMVTASGVDCANFTADACPATIQDDFQNDFRNGFIDFGGETKEPTAAPVPGVPNFIPNLNAPPTVAPTMTATTPIPTLPPSVEKTSEPAAETITAVPTVEESTSNPTETAPPTPMDTEGEDDDALQLNDDEVNTEAPSASDSGMMQDDDFLPTPAPQDGTMVPTSSTQFPSVSLIPTREDEREGLSVTLGPTASDDDNTAAPSTEVLDVIFNSEGQIPANVNETLESSIEEDETLGGGETGGGGGGDGGTTTVTPRGSVGESSTSLGPGVIAVMAVGGFLVLAGVVLALMRPKGNAAVENVPPPSDDGSLDYMSSR